MEQGTKSKKTVFVGGISDDTDETAIYQSFSTFGEIVQVQLPSAVTNQSQQSQAKHRGFAFVTYGSSSDAQDAIDNMDMNELQGRVIKVNLARPMKGQLEASSNRAIWESEEWLQQHVKPLAQSGGVQGRIAQQGEQEDTQNKSDEDMEE
ncbi:hypothetical protein K443DRAFT_672131 [Laccaria amethystina LaAM-08-1]|uniref:RRM domain-containing protein n=1 Tax=Laccaria amethystina LaAM-08-1 TaxID=1095629 RepID=A0A0C9X8R0_9AGAR|nr:hypothetical protein K443DRAFT_672131 [Laccaria amethystina LaAM-08-1]